jgi:hypothetical protein
MIIILIISLLAAAGIFLYVRYDLKKYLPFITWLTDIVRISLDFWGAKKIYQDSTLIIQRYETLINVFDFSKTSNIDKQAFAKYVYDTYIQIYANAPDKEEAARVARAVYTLIDHNADILLLLESLNDISSIDVKRTTLIFIDFLGEFFNLQSKMDKIFYEDMIYGINKVLLEIKKGGNNKQTLSKVSATLWRMYQITRAYRDLNSLSNLTKEEFERKIQEALSLILSYFQVK